MEKIKMEELKEILQKLDRYKGFTILDKPVKFKNLFAGKNIDVVQLHSIQTFDVKGYKDIVGFCGQCEWKENILTPLDGDSYYDDMLVYGYAWFDFKIKDANKEDIVAIGLDILVEDW